MQKFLNILILLFICFTFTGCSINNSRDYIWFSVDKKFAKKLAKCSYYLAPTVYRAPILIPVEKYKTRIIGNKNNVCIIRDYTAEPFEFFNKYKEYSITPQLAKELSEILVQAFNEPLYREEKANKMMNEFLRKHRISCFEENFRGKCRCVEEALTTPMFNPENNQKVDQIYNQFRLEREQCNKKKQIIINRLKNTPNYSALNKEERNDLVCNGVDEDNFNCKVYIGAYTHKLVGRLHRETPYTICRLYIEADGSISDNYYYEKKINDILQSPILKPENSQKVEQIYQQLKLEKAQCKEKKEIILKRLKETSNYLSLNKEERDNIICGDINQDDFICKIYKGGSTGKLVGSLEKETPYSRCYLFIDADGNIGQNDFNEKDIINILKSLK